MFRFTKSSCVAVGTFNIYIFQPDWIGRLERVPDGAEMELNTDLSQPGFRVRSKHLSSRWLVRPHLLVLESDDKAVDCGASMGRILEALPVTPIRAVGHNFEYRSDDRDSDSQVVGSICPGNVDGYDWRNSVRQHSIRRGDADFNLAVIESADNLVLRVNVNFELTGKTIDRAIAGAAGFSATHLESITIAKRLFGVELGNDDDR